MSCYLVSLTDESHKLQLRDKVKTELSREELSNNNNSPESSSKIGKSGIKLEFPINRQPIPFQCAFDRTLSKGIC